MSRWGRTRRVRLSYCEITRERHVSQFQHPSFPATSNETHTERRDESRRYDAKISFRLSYPHQPPSLYLHWVSSTSIVTACSIRRVNDPLLANRSCPYSQACSNSALSARGVATEPPTEGGSEKGESQSEGKFSLPPGGPVYEDQARESVV